MEHSYALSQRTDVSEKPSFAIVNSAFPAIGKKIEVFWGHPEFTSLMLDLQQDSSDRPRMGFPSYVMHALFQLEQDHDDAFPHLRRKVNSFWQTL